MAHLREQIRDRVVTDLTGLTTTGSRVFRSRIYPLENNDLPVYVSLQKVKLLIMILLLYLEVPLEF